MKWLICAALIAGCGFIFNTFAEDSATNAAPQWTVPLQWLEIAPGPAMEKAFLPMPKSTNTILVIVGRLPNKTHPERAGVPLPSFEMVGDTRQPIRSNVQLPDPNDRATMIDMLGMDSQTFVSRRRIVIKVLRSREEWMYMIVGDAGAVTLQKDAFITFVQSARYP